MSCRFLTSTTEESTRGMRITIPACKLKREVDIASWAKKCRDIHPAGPCWWWREAFGDVQDVEFEHGDLAEHV